MVSMTSLMGNKPSSTLLVAASTGILSVGLAVGVCTASLSSTQLQEKSSKSNPKALFQIESDLMDRIAQKPYLQAFTSNDERPRGVPHRVRVLAIDVPEMRYAFDGECRINLSKIYADDIAPPKALKIHSSLAPTTTTSADAAVLASDSSTIKTNNGVGQSQVRVAQKSLAKSLIKCRKQKKIGVELLEASVAELNPYNMRKTHQFGNLINYDPGKYATRPFQTIDEHESGERASENMASDKASETRNSSMQGDSTQKSVLATQEDEVDAPWNQYAWIEELYLRIHGKVVFGSILHPSSSFTRMLNGNVFQTTVPSNRGWWEWFIPPFLHRDPAGIDGNRRHRASHKPHAVIADGAAMQRVPGSMRYLQRTCQEANVPLFIVNDPRVWGGNTHQDLNDALRDMRKTIKYNIVQQSMQGSAFSRGRLLGQLETEAKWQAKDMGRRTRDVVRDANRRLQEERLNNWSNLSADDLQERLINHKAIQLIQSSDGQASIAKGTDGMVELARRFVSTLDEMTVVRNDDKNEVTEIDTPAEV